MNARTLAVVIATLVALAIWAPGCARECSVDGDCANFGEAFTCDSSGHCVLGETPADDAGDDAGTDDAGDTDAGEDAGVDAGPLLPGEACDPSASNRCEGTFRCFALEDGGGACQELWIAVTTTTDTAGGLNGVTAATLVPFNDAGTEFVFPLAQNTRWPRWSADGRRVAFVSQAIAGTRVELHLGELDGGESLLIDAPDAGTADFTQLEWEPGDALVWTIKDAGTGVGGIVATDATTAALTQVTTAGGFADWIPGGTELAYSTALGLRAVDQAGTGDRELLDGGTTPQVSPAGALVAFEYGVGGDARVVTAELDHEVWTIPTAGGTPQRITTAVLATNTVTGQAATLPAWSPDGTLLAYVRVNYYFQGGPPPGNPTLCTVGQCGVGPQQLLVQVVDPTGAPTGTATLISDGTLPAFSPDGRWLAYVNGNQLHVQEVDATGAPTGTLYSRSFTANVMTSGGDDARPRWQPK